MGWVEEGEKGKKEEEEEEGGRGKKGVRTRAPTRPWTLRLRQTTLLTSTTREAPPRVPHRLLVAPRL